MKILELKVFGDNHRTLLQEVGTALEGECHLYIVESMVVDPDPTNMNDREFSIFYCTKDVEKSAAAKEQEEKPRVDKGDDVYTLKSCTYMLTIRCN